jgi:hypothetical protein
MNKFTASNVSSFRGFTVTHGQIDISTDEYMEYLDEVYGDVTICGYTYGAGTTLEAVDPIAFRCGLGDYESEIQAELEEALENEDDSDIEFIDDMDGEE